MSISHNKNTSKRYKWVTILLIIFAVIFFVSDVGSEKLYNDIVRKKSSNAKADEKNRKFLLLKRPPDITLKSGNIKIPSYLGPSHWSYENENGTMTKQCYDFDINKFVEDIKNNNETVILPPKVLISVSCEYNIDSIVLRKEKNHGETLTKTKDNTFVLTSDKGVHCYLINCNWSKRGSGTYGFKVLVSDEKHLYKIRKIAYNSLSEQEKNTIIDWKSAGVEEYKTILEHKVANNNGGLNIKDKETYRINFRTKNEELIGLIRVYLDRNSYNPLGVDFRD